MPMPRFRPRLGPRFADTLRTGTTASDFCWWSSIGSGAENVMQLDILPTKLSVTPNAAINTKVPKNSANDAALRKKPKLTAIG